MAFFLKLVVFLLFFGGIALYCFLKREQLSKFYQEVRFEMTKVTWLTQDEVINSTILVLIVTAILAMGCWVVDLGFSFILQGFYSS